VSPAFFRKYRNGGLDDDRAMVELGGHEMHRTTMDFDAGRKCLRVRRKPRECRQQRRMDIDEPTRVTLDEPGVTMRMNPAIAISFGATGRFSAASAASNASRVA
jgi:hypothetical protein